MNGKIYKKENNTWVVIPTGSTKELPTHPNQLFSIETGLAHGADVCFEVNTIATGNSELDIMDVDVAWLIPCQPDDRY